MRFGHLMLCDQREWVSSRDRYEQMMEEVRLMDQLGYWSVWFSDHHFDGYALIPDSLMACAAAARETQNIQLGARTGAMNNAWAGHVTGRDHVAMGNGLVGEGVVQAMAAVFAEAPELDLEERLMRTLEAGQRAGGEAQDSPPYHSAALLIYGSDTFSRVDLRVDENATPVVELRRLLDIYAPKIDYFALRATDPEAAQAAKDAGL